MRNKTSTTVISIPLENKEAKAKLKQIYADIKVAEDLKAKNEEDKEVLLGASQEKESVLKELSDLNDEVEGKKAVLADTLSSISETSKELSKNNNLLEEFKKVIEKIKSEIKTLKENAKSEEVVLKKIISSLKKEQESEIETLQSLKDTKTSLISKLDSEIEYKDKQLSDKSTLLFKFGTQISALEEVFEEKKTEYGILLTSFGELAEKETLLNETISKAEEKLSKIEDKIATSKGLFESECSRITTENDAKYQKIKEDLEKREGNVSLDEKRLRNKQAELKNAKKELEDLYGRKLTNINI